MEQTFLRDDHRTFDEIGWIAEHLSTTTSKGVMMDVGAHVGGSFDKLARKGWEIHAFEPFPSHFEKLKRTWGHQPNVHLYNVAVSDRQEKNLPFFVSPESDGTNSLSPFLDSHDSRLTVESSTLTAILEPLQPLQIDFLKIDTEGYDLMALKGFPWNKTQPRIIIAEFEDRKTIPLGYTCKDMIHFLKEKGYHVMLSEWHPIVRYGITHEFKKLWPIADAASIGAKGWGNLIAVADDTIRRALIASTSLFVYKHIPPPPSIKNIKVKLKSIMIFGTGECGEAALAYLTRKGANITGFIDNDRRKQGKCLCGIPIMSLEESLEETTDAVVVASAFYREIVTQLETLNVYQDRLFSYLRTDQ